MSLSLSASRRCCWSILFVDGVSLLSLLSESFRCRQRLIVVAVFSSAVTVSLLVAASTGFGASLLSLSSDFCCRSWRLLIVGGVSYSLPLSASCCRCQCLVVVVGILSSSLSRCCQRRHPSSWLLSSDSVPCCRRRHLVVIVGVYLLLAASLCCCRRRLLVVVVGVLMSLSESHRCCCHVIVGGDVPPCGCFLRILCLVVGVVVGVLSLLLASLCCRRRFVVVVVVRFSSFSSSLASRRSLQNIIIY